MFPFNFIDSSSAIVCAESSVKFKTKTKMNAVSGNAAIFNELLLFACVIFDIVSDNWHLYDICASGFLHFSIEISPLYQNRELSDKQKCN